MVALTLALLKVTQRGQVSAAGRVGRQTRYLLPASRYSIRRWSTADTVDGEAGLSLSVERVEC